MKLAVLGGLGKTAREVILHALDRGYEVRAIDLQSSKKQLNLDYKNLEVVGVAGFVESELRRVFSGCHAVLFCLEHEAGPFVRVTIFSQTIHEVITAVRATGITRVVALTARCTKPHPRHPLYHEWLLRPLVLGRALSDMLRMERYLCSTCRDVNFTVVKPPKLIKGHHHDIYEENIMAVEGEFVREGRASLPRPYLAKFMIDCLRLTLWDKKLVAIALPS